ncbi:hypothetical protein GQ600_21433 [Phytophthora cactorum]|nr:hypothetical protein GQ600_21433 [Phytophthora cactorum]
MAPASSKKKLCYGDVAFFLEASDLPKARDMGLLRSGVAVQQCDPTNDDYGVGCARRDNVGAEYDGSRKAI